MKCELCHKAKAEAAITRGEGDNAEELYVCKACAKQERIRAQKKSQRTRKVSGLPPGVSMSVTEIGPDGEGGEGEPPPIIGALLDAFKDLADDLKKIPELEKARAAANEAKYHDFPLSRVPSNYRIGPRLHLEGLHLIGELDAVKRAAHALSMDLVGINVDCVRDAGHAYLLRYAGTTATAKRFVEDLLREERNARVRLFEELPRILGDAIGRALAILKNCRLLASAELFDLLSPIRLAAMEDLLDGITLARVEKLLLNVDLTGDEDNLSPDERDKIDADRADKMNRKFEDVVLNERAEGNLL